MSAPVYKGFYKRSFYWSKKAYTLMTVSQVAVSSNVVRRWGAGTAAVMRLLVASEVPQTGVAIAAGTGVTQPRVSQILKQLMALSAVAATADGYIGDPSELLKLYRTRTRPYLVEPESYWYSTRPITDQARRVNQLSLDSEALIAFSADLAPDLIAPWRHPTIAVVYTDKPLPMAAAGFVPAEGRADASLILRRTDDRRLLSPAPPWTREVDGYPITDPCQQWWDLQDLGGEDRAEAADRLHGSIITRSIPRCQ